MAPPLRYRRLMQIYRIGDQRHPLWDGTGAALVGGRWNSPGRPVIYGSLSYACCMLEILAHANIGRVPVSHRFVVADVPSGIKAKRYDEVDLPKDWDRDNSQAARNFGDQWLDERKSAILLVPSVVARLEWNALVNPLHPDARRLTISNPQKVIWDARLFSGKKS